MVKGQAGSGKSTFVSPSPEPFLYGEGPGLLGGFLKHWRGDMVAEAYIPEEGIVRQSAESAPGLPVLYGEEQRCYSGSAFLIFSGCGSGLFAGLAAGSSWIGLRVEKPVPGFSSGSLSAWLLRASTAVVEVKASAVDRCTPDWGLGLLSGLLVRAITGGEIADRAPFHAPVNDGQGRGTWSARDR